MVLDCTWGVSLWYRTAHGELVYGTGLLMSSLSMSHMCVITTHGLFPKHQSWKFNGLLSTLK